VASTYEKEIIKCIALAKFLNIPEFTILGSDGVPKYSDSKQEEWLEYLADDCWLLTHDFCQMLNLHVTYEGNSKAKYIKACRRGKDLIALTLMPLYITCLQSLKRLTRLQGVSLLSTPHLDSQSFLHQAVSCNVSSASCQSRWFRQRHQKKGTAYFLSGAIKIKLENGESVIL
jgi:hypothetical protein